MEVNKMEERNFGGNRKYNFDPYTGQPLNNGGENNQFNSQQNGQNNQFNGQYNSYNGQQNGQYNSYNRHPNHGQYQNYDCYNCHERAIRKSVKSIVWLLIVIVYFLLSFSTGAWHVTWLIFLVGACVSSITNLIINLGRKENKNIN